jgi:uncharacterized protein (DUF952 family)
MSVFKIVSRSDWESIKSSGASEFTGLGIDLADKYIHLSKLEQVPGTLAKFFAGRTDLLLLQVNVEPLGERLTWEGGSLGEAELFPHLYGGGFPLSAVVAVHTVGFDEETKTHSIPN